MEIELPQGCNVYYGTYVDNYNNNVRSRYYFNEGKLVLSDFEAITSADVPDNTLCVDSLTYGSQYTIYFEFISLVCLFAAWLLIYRVFIKRLLP